MKTGTQNRRDKPRYGTFAMIAKEEGVHRNTIALRFRNGDPKTIKRVAEIEGAYRKEQREAERMLAKALSS